MSAPSLRSAVEAALKLPRSITARLYTDGEHVRWLQEPRKGWERVGAVVKVVA